MTKQEILIAEMIIGDGFLNRRNLEILHSTKQEEYLKWKRNILIKNGIECGNILKKNNNGFPASYFYTKNYDFIQLLREKIYTPKKTFNIDILKNFDELGLAIWYLDDGGLSQKKHNGKIHGNDLMLNTGLQKEENQVLIDYFKQYWDISFTQVKNHSCYRLRCGTKEARKFINLIKEYVPNCMNYKIAIKEKSTVHVW